MPASPEDLFTYLDRLGIKHSTVSHPPLFTVEQSQALRGQIPGGHTKNLFLKDKKDALFLVVALEDARIDLKGLHRLLGATGRFSFGSANLLQEVWGVAPGAVTPFGALNDTAGRVTVVLEFRPDAPCGGECPSAGEYPHHKPCLGRFDKVPGGDRTSTPDHGGDGRSPSIVRMTI